MHMCRYAQHVAHPEFLKRSQNLVQNHEPNASKEAPAENRPQAGYLGRKRRREISLVVHEHRHETYRENPNGHEYQPDCYSTDSGHGDLRSAP